MNLKKLCLTLTAFAMIATTSQAQENQKYKITITKDLAYVDIILNNKPFRIFRNQDPKHKLTNSYAKTSRPCPPFCVEPFQPITGVETYGELELLNFLQNEVNNNKGILVDARLPKWYQEGTIPGAINLPFTILNPDKSNAYLEQILPILGATKKDDGSWDFTNAQTLLIFDNGPWCQQGTRAIKHLVEIGYPKDKIKYYRGGMQYWQVLGFNVIKSK